jgi:hypothetical protein
MALVLVIQIDEKASIQNGTEIGGAKDKNAKQCCRVKNSSSRRLASERCLWLILCDLEAAHFKISTTASGNKMSSL